MMTLGTDPTFCALCFTYYYFSTEPPHASIPGLVDEGRAINYSANANKLTSSVKVGHCRQATVSTLE